MYYVCVCKYSIHESYYITLYLKSHGVEYCSAWYVYTYYYYYYMVSKNLYRHTYIHISVHKISDNNHQQKFVMFFFLLAKFLYVDYGITCIVYVFVKDVSEYSLIYTWILVCRILYVPTYYFNSVNNNLKFSCGMAKFCVAPVAAVSC